MDAIGFIIGASFLFYFLGVGILAIKRKRDEAWWALVIGALLLLTWIRFH
ncbi:hypothetical protein [Thermococcus waiotapuensis]|uniref:Uncharacterized protein n=1 Tax=Thermococcus waiotapuensis TaxID=90909 RepID=A0AAE4T1G8_9EURY|nr:hypothetical protein [Thermococcus waiotapuensis]MDV3103192.1 hypothetical protein [Thermococcus waiotapuensis]